MSGGDRSSSTWWASAAWWSSCAWWSPWAWRASFASVISGRVSSSVVWPPFGRLAGTRFVGSSKGFVEGRSELLFGFGSRLGNHGWWGVLLGELLGPSGVWRKV